MRKTIITASLLVILTLGLTQLGNIAMEGQRIHQPNLR